MEKKIYGVLVDPEKGIAKAMEIEGGLHGYYEALRCELIEIPQRSIGRPGHGMKSHCIVCDEEGLLTKREVSAVDAYGFGQMVGPIFICDESEDGSELVSLSEAEAKRILDNEIIKEKCILKNLGYDIDEPETYLTGSGELTGILIDGVNKIAMDISFKDSLDEMKNILGAQQISVIFRKVGDESVMVFLDNCADDSNMNAYTAIDEEDKSPYGLGILPIYGRVFVCDTTGAALSAEKVAAIKNNLIEHPDFADRKVLRLESSLS